MTRLFEENYIFLIHVSKSVGAPVPERRGNPTRAGLYVGGILTLPLYAAFMLGE